RDHRGLGDEAGTANPTGSKVRQGTFEGAGPSSRVDRWRSSATAIVEGWLPITEPGLQADWSARARAGRGGVGAGLLRRLALGPLLVLPLLLGLPRRLLESLLLTVREDRGADDAGLVAQLRRHDLALQVQQGQELPVLLRDPAADDDPGGAEEELEVGEVLLEPARPGLPVQLLLVLD